MKLRCETPHFKRISCVDNKKFADTRDIEVIMNRKKQIIVVVMVFVLAAASLGTVVGLLVNTGQMSEYSDGFRYTLSGSRATITGYEGSDVDVIVPDKVRGNRVVGIKKGAFADKASTIKSVTFKSTASFSIEAEAFKEMTALERVVLPSNLKEIPTEAFNGCKALRSVIIPNSVTKIGEKAFNGCTSLKFAYNSASYGNGVDEEKVYLPTSLREIGAYAFDGCSGIQKLDFGKNLQKVGNYAFNECGKLSEISVADDCELANVGERAFYGTIIQSTESSPLKFPHLAEIGVSAFSNVRNNFSYFSIPADVKNIGANAFKGCSTLSKVEFAENVELENMGEGVFEDCTTLSDVLLPANLKKIPAKTFMGCSRLLYNRDFTIGKEVEEIGEGAFAIYTNSTSYSARNYVLKVNEENEFFKIVELKEFKKSTSDTTTYKQGLLTNSDGSEVYAYYGSYDETSTIADGKTFKFLDKSGNDIEGIKTIKGYAFAGVAFEYILLRNTVRNIGDYAFFKSKIEVAYIGSINWEWTEKTFVKETDKDPDVEVLILRSTASASEIAEFIEKLSDAVEGAGSANDSTLP